MQQTRYLLSVELGIGTF